MNVGEWIGAAVGITVLLGIIGRLLWAIHNGVNLIHDMHDEVTAVRKELSNGIRGDVKKAGLQAGEARTLAAEAARTASIAEQRVTEASHNLTRELRSLRSEIDTVVRIATSDMASIWQQLAAAGMDRRGGER